MESPRSHLLFYVNGIKYDLSEKEIEPEMTLLQFLRTKLQLTGTKLGCGEGGCGACTVMASSWQEKSQSVIHRSINACLTPLASIDSCAITTVEGIGSHTTNSGLHPVQKVVANAHGSQCGFCTPGFVMAMYTMMQQNDKTSGLTMKDLEHGLDGNLCRCTGYRPLLDAVKSFATDFDESCSGSCDGCKIGAIAGDIEDLEVVRTCSRKHMDELSKLNPSKENMEPVFPFPEELKLLNIGDDKPLILHGTNVQWYAPTTLHQLLSLKTQHPDAKLSVGNTELTIDRKFKYIMTSKLINVKNIPELNVFSTIENASLNESSYHGIHKQHPNFTGVEIGSAVPLTDVSALLEKYSSELKPAKQYLVRGFEAIVKMLRYFASTHIRNVACLGGNLATASPISDMNPLLASMNAIIELKSLGERDEPTEISRYVAVGDFFLGYRTVDLKKNEIIRAIFIPFTRLYEYVEPFKQARRREDDISIVTAGIRMNFSQDKDSNNWIIDDASIVYGGMAPITKAAVTAESSLKGKSFQENTILQACDTLLQNDFQLPSTVPGGMAIYRETLAISFLYQFYIGVVQRLKLDTSSNILQQSLPDIPSSHISGGQSYMSIDRPISNGTQVYGMEKGGITNSKHQLVSDQIDRAPVGKPLKHQSADVQVSGEAKYTDDISVPHGTLHAAFVVSNVPHGILKNIDAKQALAVHGVVAFYDASVFLKSSHLGRNDIGPVLRDEECFASERILCVGQPIGLVVAESHELASFAAAKLVHVEIEELPAVLSIQDAITADPPSFYPNPHCLDYGSVDKGMTESDVIIEGEVDVGGQEQFYLETNVSLCIPEEGGASMSIISSTQAATKTQVTVAQVLGVPSNRVVCRTKRIGGGFGGKETRSVFIACAAAVAAKELNRPVKLLLERDVDMLLTGSRHPFHAKYKVGANRDGKILALDVKLYNNAGYSMDLSQAVMDRALFHVDNTYKIPNVRAIGYVCRTNLPTNTAFRGFGGPQGLFVAETYIEHLAKVLSCDIMKIREINMYKAGEVTHFGQPLEPSSFNLQTLWNDSKNAWDYNAKKQAVADFNAKNRWVKQGIAMIPTKFGISFTAKFMNQGGSLVHVYADGSVLVSHGGVEMGQGLHTKVTQVAAKSFGIPIDQVRIHETSTDKVANTQPSAASMSTDLYGMATLDACEQILARLKPFLDNPKYKSFAEATNAAYFARVNLSAQGFYIVPNDRCGYDWALSVEENAANGTPFNYFTTGVACAIVEANLLTGDYYMKHVDIGMDLGASVNPAIDVGQIEGAFMQGFGLFAMEELLWGDGKNGTVHPWIKPGHLFTRGPGTYKIPSGNDVPLQFNIWLATKSKNPFTVHSSRAVGEPPLFLGASVLFALKDALYAGRLENENMNNEYFQFNSPATCERVRVAGGDKLLEKVFANRQERDGTSVDAFTAMLNYQVPGSF